MNASFLPMTLFVESAARLRLAATALLAVAALGLASGAHAQASPTGQPQTQLPRIELTSGMYRLSLIHI